MHHSRWLILVHHYECDAKGLLIVKNSEQLSAGLAKGFLLQGWYRVIIAKFSSNFLSRDDDGFFSDWLTTKFDLKRINSIGSSEITANYPRLNYKFSRWRGPAFRWEFFSTGWFLCWGPPRLGGHCLVSYSTSSVIRVLDLRQYPIWHKCYAFAHSLIN